MDHKSISSVMNKLSVAFGRQFPDVTDIAMSEKDGNSIIEFKVAATDVTWTYAADGDFLTLKSTSHLPNMNDEELYEWGGELLGLIDAQYTAYNGTLVFQKVEVFGGTDDDAKDTEREVFNTTMRFVQSLVLAKAELSGKQANGSALRDRDTRSTDAGPEHEDPFGFDELAEYGESGCVTASAEIKSDDTPDSDNVPDSNRTANSDNATDYIPEEETIMQDYVNQQPDSEPVLDSSTAALDDAIESLSHAVENDEFDPNACKAADDLPLPPSSDDDEGYLVDEVGAFRDSSEKLVLGVQSLSDLFDKTLSRSREVYCEMKNAKDAYAAQAQEAELQIREMKQRAADAQQQAADAQDRLEEAERRLNEANQKIKELSAETSSRFVVMDLRKKNMVQADRISELDGRIAQSLVIIKELQRNLKALQQEKASWKQRESALESEAEQSARSAASSAESKYKETIAEMERKYEETADELERRTLELESYEEQVDKLRVELDDVRSKLVEATTPISLEATAIKVQDELKKLGLNAEPLPGESEMILSSSYKGCQVSVDVSSNIAYLTKDIKRIKKAVTELDRLNAQNIRTAYTVTDGKICCKAFYANDTVSRLVSAIADELAKFD